MRSIYENPYKYAVTCNIPYELAKIACIKQRRCMKMMKKNRPYCPNCGSKHIQFEYGSYEEGYDDYFECEDCGETYSTCEVPNSKYFPFFGFDFDPVLHFSYSKNREEGWCEACGKETIDEWHKFARKMIIGRSHQNKNLTKM